MEIKLTLPQQDVYFEQLLYPNEPIYNIGAKIKIEGIINTKIFKRAYKALIDQHDAYRTIFFNNQENIICRILENHNTELKVADFSNHKHPDNEANGFIQKEFTKPFDILSSSLLHKFILIKIANNIYYLFSVYHHIITDGWGASLMFQRLVKNYNEICEFGEIKSVYPFSYKNFVIDDDAYQKSESFNKDKAYWTEKFRVLPESLFDKIDQINQGNKSRRKVLYIKRKTYNKLNKLAKDYKSSTFHLILAALYLYFGKKHQINDFAVGLPVLNRSKSIFKKTVGLFMGVSPLRIQLNPENTLQDLINEIKNQLRQDYRHQRFPLGKIIQELQAFQEKEKLFNITLSYEKQNYATNFERTKTTVTPLTHQSERVALAIYIREFDDQEDVKIDFDYNLNYFDATRITQVVRHFENLLNNILSTPDKKLKELKYISEKERQKLIIEFNNTAVKYPKDKTLLYVFNEQVKRYPENIAVFDEQKKYSYSELNALSDRIAKFLLINKKKENNTTPIGVLLERSATIIAVLFGILKAGKAFIPLDPKFPLERLKYIIKHSGLKTLISDQEVFNMETIQVAIHTVDDLLKTSNNLKGNPSTKVKATDTAYIIYTSGSTGNPKGVEIGHRSLLNFLLSIQKKPGIRDTDCLFAVTTYSFDISILELFAPLISGACVFIANDITLVDPEKIIETLKKINPSIVQATPSFYQLLFNAGWEGSKELRILCGGDLLSEDLAEKLLKSCNQLWNMYGPTETTIWSSIKQIKSSKDASNIGTPIANTQFYILDEFKDPLPIGARGILHIGGDGLAKGYLNNVDLTRERFLPNPFQKGTLLYNTGDVTKWNFKGDIEFLGRHDNQVKIRGFRIELAEIETKINLIPEVKQAVVIAKKRKNQEAFLVAFIIKEKDDYDEKKIVYFLDHKLPKYMIPQAIIALKEFPLTPNKKIDRKALINKNFPQNKEEDTFKRPDSELQVRLIKYWQKVLQIKYELSITDNFFALGGHSLNIIKLKHLINVNLGYSINLKTIFDYPTIESLSKHLKSIELDHLKKIPIAGTKDYYALIPSQYEIWLASQDKNMSIAYNMVAAFHAEGKVFIGKINDTINKMLLKHEILRTNFVEINGIACQQVKPYSSVNFHVSWSRLKESEAESKIDEYINQEFDLKNDLLIKMKLIQTGGDTSILVFCTHHIIMDGWSLELFIKEFVEYYNDSSKHQVNNVQENKAHIQFKDYSEWFTSSVNSCVEKPFWEKYLSEYQPKESFKTDKVIEKKESESRQCTFKLDKRDTQALKKLTQEHQTTLHNLLVAAMNVLIYKYCNHDDICLATVNSGRDLPELDSIIGMFVKTLILRTKISGQQTFNEVLQNIQRDLLRIYNYQHIPQQINRKSIFDILIVYQNPDFSYQEVLKLKEAKLKSYPAEINHSRLPLIFDFLVAENELNISITYNSKLYEKNTIQIILLKFEKVINQVTENPAIKISQIDDLLEFEKGGVIDFNLDF